MGLAPEPHLDAGNLAFRDSFDERQSAFEWSAVALDRRFKGCVLVAFVDSGVWNAESPKWPLAYYPSPGYIWTRGHAKVDARSL